MGHHLVPPKGSTRVKVLLGILLGILIAAGVILVLQAKGIINPGFLKTQIPAGYAESYLISTTKINNVSISHNSSGDVITVGHSDTDMDGDCTDEGAFISIDYSTISLSYTPSSGRCTGTYATSSLYVDNGISISIESGSINMSTYGSSSSPITSWSIDTEGGAVKVTAVDTGTTTTTCDSGYYWDSGSQSCVSLCGTTGTWNGSYCEYPTPAQCNIGDKCTSGSWCNMGQQCFYSDSSFTCVDWNNSCPTGTTYCSPSDTNCIEPGKTGPLTGWCKNGKECYTSDSSQKYCQPWSTTTTAMTVTCPTGMSACNPTDQYCLEVGDPPSTLSGAWCSGSKQCYLSDGSTKCVKFEDSCPNDSTSCRPNETLCVEPGKMSTTSGAWCGGSSMQCFKGETLYCQPMSSTDMMSWQTAECQTGYSECRSTDQWCLEEIGDTGPSGSWCAKGKPEYTSDNKVKCVPFDDDDTTVEPVEPEEPVLTCAERACYNSSGTIESCVKWGQKCPSEYEEEKPEEEKEVSF